MADPEVDLENGLQEFLKRKPAATPNEQKSFLTDYASELSQLRQPRKTLGVDVRTATEGIEKGSLGKGYKEAAEETRQRFGRDEGSKIINKASFAQRTFNAARSSLGGLKREVDRVVDPALKGEYLQALEAAQKASIHAPLSAIERTLNAADTPDRVWREGINSYAEDRPMEFQDALFNDNGAGDFDKYYEHVKSAIPQGARDFAFDVTQRAVASQLQKYGVPTEAAREVSAPSSEFLGKLGVGIAQPSTLFTLGLAGGSKTTASQIQRAARASGLSTGNAKVVAEAIASLYETKGATPQIAEQAKALFVSAGGDAAKLAKVIGSEAEFIGKGGVQVAGVDVSALASRATGLPEQLTRRGLEKVARIGAKKIPTPLRPTGLVDLPYHSRRGLERAIVKQKHQAIAAIQQDLEAAVTDVAPSATGISKERQAELILQHFEPDIQLRHGQWELASSGGQFPMTAPEQKFVDAVENYFKTLGSKVGRAGTGHPVTGRYVPRQYAPSREPLANMQNIFQPEIEEFGRATPFKKRGSGGKISVTDVGTGEVVKVKNPGVPLGRGQLNAETDPFKIIANYTPKIERHVASANYERFLADNFSQPRAGNMKLNQFARMRNSAGKRVWVPKELREEGRRVFNSFTIPYFDAAQNNFKVANLLPVPRFHLLNAIEDTFKMIASGFKNPEAFAWVRQVKDHRIPDSAILFNTPLGRRITVGEARAGMIQNGYLHSVTGGSFDFAPQRGARDFAYEMEKATTKAELPGVLRAPQRLAKNIKARPGRAVNEAYLDVVGLGPVRRIGKKWAEKWESYSKGAHYLDQLARGVPEGEAAAKTSQFLFDHAVQSSAQQALRRVSPFIGYTMKTTTALPKLLGKNPKMALAPLHLQRAMKQENEDVAPLNARTRFPIATAPESYRQLVGKLSKKVGEATGGAIGGEINPGAGMAIGLRGDPIEGAAGPLEFLAGSGGNQLAQSQGFPFNYMMEQQTGQDLLTGADLDPADGLLTPRQFNYGTPGIPDELQAAEGQIAPLARYGTAWLGPWARLGLNVGARMLGAPGPVAGAQRSYAEDAGVRDFLQAAELTGVPSTYLTDPMQEQKDIANQPEVERHAKTGGYQKKRVREEKRKRKK